MQLKVGGRYGSQVCSTEVIVVKAPAGEVTLECGGHPMVVHGSDATPGLSGKPDLMNGSPLGKRYTDADGSLEVLVVKPGDGSLGLDGTALQLKESRPLPSSD